MSQFRISDEAREDLNAIWVYLAERSSEAADRVTASIIERFPRLATFPQMGRRRDDVAPSLRTFAVGGYVIFYRLIEAGIEIVRVLHGARDIDGIFRHEEPPE